MKVRSPLKFFVSCVSVVLVASCSRTMQPVSVDSGGGPVTTAAISDLSIRDMGWAGGQLWAVTRQARGSDYYLARYSSSTQRWVVLTSYWGQKCAVSNSGKCYHVNAAGQIWWVTRNPNGTYSNQRITTLPANKVARDIGVGPYDGQEQIWVRFRDNAGNYTVERAAYSGSGSSVEGGSTGWYQHQVWGGSPKCVSADPYYGYTAIGIVTSNYMTLWDPDAHGMEIPDLNCNLVDAAVCDGNFIVVTDDQKLYRNFEVVNRFATTSVSLTKIFGVLYAMYINSSNRLECVRFEDLHN